MSQIHLRAEEGDYAPLVLLPGDPDRATRIAASFDGGLEASQLVNDHRGMLGYTGTFQGTPVSVQTSGMGTPSLSIVVEELLRLGARRLIRVGTTGGIELKIGRPVLMGVPLARPLSLVVAGSASLPNEEEVVRQIHGRLPAYAEQQGAVMASEPAIRALCEKKLMEYVASFLAEQPGVTQVPIIHVVYK